MTLRRRLDERFVLWSAARAEANLAYAAEEALVVAARSPLAA